MLCPGDGIGNADMDKASRINKNTNSTTRMIVQIESKEINTSTAKIRIECVIGSRRTHILRPSDRTLHLLKSRGGVS